MKKLILIAWIIALLAVSAFAGPSMQTGSNYNPSAVAITGGTISGVSVTVPDYQYLPVSDGMSSVLVAPDAAATIQGPVGSQLLVNGTNAVWTQGATPFDTLTVNANHIDIDSIVYSSTGTQTATSNSITIVTGKLYRLLATETHTSGAHIVISGTGGFPTTTLAAGANNIYFRATGNAIVLTITATAASNNACTFTLYEYSRPAIARDYSNTTQQSLVFDWMPPLDWNSGPITFTPYGVVTAATPPANNETVIMSVSGFCVPTSGSLSTATGTAVTSTFTADATYARYDEWKGAETSAITLAGALAGSKCRIMVDRLTSDTYEQKIGLTGGNLSFTRVLSALEPETATYLALPSPLLSSSTANSYIKAVKYGSGVVISGMTVNISNATGALFLTNPSVDLRWLKGFYLNLNDGSKNFKVLVGNAGTGESLGSNILASYDLTSGWNATGCSITSANSFTLTAASGGPSKVNTVTAGALYKGSLTSTQSLGGTTRVDLGSSMSGINNGQSDIYRTAPTTYAEFYNTAGGIDNLVTITAVNLQPVLTPSALGALFSTPTVDAGFNYNAASYTATATRN